MAVRLPGIGSKAIALVAALFVLVAASVVMDRLGAPAELTRTLVVIVSAVSMGMAGALTRTVRGSTYLSAGQRLGGVRGTSIALVAAMGLTFAASGMSPTLEIVTALALGLILHAVLISGPMQRAGASTLGALALGRYRSVALCLIVGVAAFCITALLALVIGAKAVALLQPATGLHETTVRLGIASLALLTVLPGGYASLAAVSVIIVLLATAGTGFTLASAWVQRAGAIETATLGMLRDVLSVGTTPEILALACAFAGLLAIFAVAASCRTPTLARTASAAAALIVLGLSAAIDVAWLAIAAAMPGPKAMDGLAVSMALAMPAPFGVLFILMPGLFLTGLLAAMARCGATALVQDALGALGGNRSAMSGRLALNRIVAIIIILVASSGVAPVPEWQPAWVRGMLTAVATVPAALLLPAFFRSGDWRASGISLLAAIGLTAVATTEATALPIWQVAAIFFGATACALLLFRSRLPADAQAADIVAGRATGPLLLVRDA